MRRCLKDSDGGRGSLEWIYCINRWLVKIDSVPQLVSHDHEASKTVRGDDEAITKESMKVTDATEIARVATASANSAKNKLSTSQYQFVTSRGENDTPIAHCFKGYI